MVSIIGHFFSLFIEWIKEIYIYFRLLFLVLSVFTWFKKLFAIPNENEKCTFVDGSKINGFSVHTSAQNGINTLANCNHDEQNEI